MEQTLDEKRFRIYRRDYNMCRRCGTRKNLQLAHGIAQTKDNAKMIKRLYGEMFHVEITIAQAWEIIHSDYNLYTSCDKCNSYFNFGFKPELVKKFLRNYYDATKEENSL